MADNLLSLPYPANFTPTDDEQEVHKIFYTEGGGKCEKDIKYVMLYASILFFLLSTSYADEFIHRIPYCESGMSVLLAKTIIFALGFLIIHFLLV